MIVVIGRGLIIIRRRVKGAFYSKNGRQPLEDAATSIRLLSLTIVTTSVKGLIFAVQTRISTFIFSEAQENPERYRFEVELEFVQCLASPHYLNCKQY